MSNHPPVKSISWYPNGDIHLVLKHEDEPDVRIERGSLESIPFESLLLEVLSHTTKRAQKGVSKGIFKAWRGEKKSRKGKNQPSAASPLPVESTEVEAPINYPRSQSNVPVPSIRSEVELRDDEKSEMAQMNASSVGENSARGTGTAFGQSNTNLGDDPNGPPDSHYDEELGGEMAGDDYIPTPEWAEDPTPTKSEATPEPVVAASPEPIARPVVQPRSAPTRPDYASLANSPENWITGFAPETWIKKPEIELGDYSKVAFDKSISKHLEDISDLSTFFLESYQRKVDLAREKDEAPIEKSHELIRWPDGENGSPRFAVAVAGRQVPVHVDEQLSNGLIKMMEDGSLEHITALHDPVEKKIGISYVKTKHFDSLIPVEEASRMSVEEYFPSTYPRSKEKAVTTEARLEEMAAVGDAYEDQDVETIPTPVELPAPEVSPEEPAVELADEATESIGANEVEFKDIEEAPPSEEVPVELLETQFTAHEIDSDEGEPPEGLNPSQGNTPPPVEEIPEAVLESQADEAVEPEPSVVDEPEAPVIPVIPKFVGVSVAEVANGWNTESAQVKKQEMEVEM